MVSPAKGNSDGLIHKNDDLWMGMGPKAMILICYDVPTLFIHNQSCHAKSVAWLSSIHLGATASSRRRCGSESRPANMCKASRHQKSQASWRDEHTNNALLTSHQHPKLQRFFLHAKHSQKNSWNFHCRIQKMIIDAHRCYCEVAESWTTCITAHEPLLRNSSSEQEFANRAAGQSY